MKPVQPIKQSLSLNQLHQGFMSALEQAERLTEESLMLARKKLFSGALSKLILGFEEVGKNRLFLYQAATLVKGAPHSWEDFWDIYFDHKKKIKFAMEWATILSPQLASADDVAMHIKFISEEASRLDIRKHESQCVGLDGDSVTVPGDDEVREETIILGIILESFCRRLRDKYPTNLPEDEFRELVSEKIRLNRTVGFIATEEMSLTEWAGAVADGNSSVRARNGVLPSKNSFRMRVEERYEIIPARLPITLRSLNGSREFERFYEMLKGRYRYPDWMILSTIYNIALHARVVAHLTEPPQEEEMRKLADWAEKPNYEPLPVELFTDEDTFTLAVELWLTAFLDGLGINIPNLTADNKKKVRRVASRYYSVFEYDVEHWPIFHFTTESQGQP